MKALVFLVTVFSFLLCGTNTVAANAKVNRHILIEHFQRHGHGKATHTDQGSTLIEDTDFDINEEINVSDNVKDVNKLLVGKYSLPQNYTTSNIQLVPNHFNRGFNTFPPLQRHTPIYITQQVLRI